jgi:glycerophosphoryl diester phosphodiesterase
MPTPLIDEATPGARLNRSLVIGHRGASGLAPENTLAAFRLAVELGADGVELDVQLSADGVPVVIHDARVNRTTNARGAVSRFMVDKLQSLDAGTWFERRLARRPRTRAIARRLTASSFSGELLPTLEDALALFESAGLERIYIELKGTTPNRVLLLDRVLSLVRRSWIHRSITLLSFDHAIIRRAKEFDGDLRTAATFPASSRRLVSTRSIVRAAEDARVDEVALHFGLVTKRRVEALHENGLAVSVWTVNSKRAMRRVTACGVDSIMTNFPHRLREVLESPPRRRVKAFRRRLGGRG